ncbi:MAG: helix-turn-helix domain-containing protein [Planctomycetes bacterium]|nr:helix-turn-helix domain-containing protein [Planctomycetota bacterium]
MDATLAMRPREAAKALGISTRTLWTWTQAGTIPHVKLGRAVLYPRTTLEKFLAERTKGANHEV